MKINNRGEKGKHKERGQEETGASNEGEGIIDERR
jgi:hypothetical protein